MGCLTTFAAESVTREATRERCDRHPSKRAAGYACFVWGAAALCEACLKEEERMRPAKEEEQEKP